MAFTESGIKDVGVDEQGHIMSRNKYNSMPKPTGSPNLIQGGSPTRPRPMGIRYGGVMGTFKKGGTVKKTGVYKLHKGEEVVPAKKKEMASKMQGKDSGYGGKSMSVLKDAFRKDFGREMPKHLRKEKLMESKCSNTGSKSTGFGFCGKCGEFHYKK